MTFRAARRMGAMLAVAVIIPACHFTGTAPSFFDPFPPSTVNAVLSGSQVVPAVTTAATGTATLVIDGMQTSIAYTISATGLGTVTAVRIHVGAAGTNGSSMFTIATAPFTNPLTGTLTSVNFTPVPGTSNFGSAIARILSGDAYLVITTVANPAGEIRGQLGAALLASAKMTGAQVVAPVVTTATGSATFQLDSAQSQIGVTLTVTGLTGITGARINVGAAGVGGGATIFTLAAATFTSPLTKTLASADFTAGGGLATFSDAVNALLSGTLYVDVTTTGNPGGEIRGQIGPAQMTAALAAGSVVPTNSSTATGTANIALNGRQTGLTVHLTHTVGSPTGVLIHADAPGSNGPLIFDVAAAAGASTSPLDVFMDGLLLVPQSSKGINEFPDATDAMLTGQTYIDVQSTGFPAGEIRGQILP